MSRSSATAQRLTLLALIVFAAWTPLLPTIELKVAATLSAAGLLWVSWFARGVSGEALGRTPLDAPALTFLLVTALATFFAETSVAGVLAATRRGDGLLLSLAYVTMALAAARLDRRDSSRLVAAVAWSGILVGAIAVGQSYGLDVTGWSARMGTLSVLPAGTLGSRMFLGGYLTLLLPLCATLAVDDAEPRSWLYAAAAAVAFAALVASQNRAAWVGSALAGALLVRLLPQSLEGVRRLTVLGAAGAAITIVMVVTQPHAALVNRALSTFDPGGVSLHQHGVVWKQTLSLIGRAPVLGWGFSIPVDRLPGAASSPAVPASAGGLLITDITPNELLHVACVSGLAGLAAYLWVWGTLVVRLRASLRARIVRPYFPAAILASLLAYFVWLQLVWSRPGPAHVFWVLAGLAVAVTRPDEGAARGARSPAPEAVEAGETAAPGDGV